MKYSNFTKFFGANIPHSNMLTSYQDIINLIGRNGLVYSESGNTINPKAGVSFIIRMMSYNVVQIAVAYGTDASMYVSSLVDGVWTNWKEK